MVTEHTGTLVLEDKENQDYWMRVSEAARVIGVSAARISELLHKKRIPEAEEREEVTRGGNLRIRRYIPRKRCIIPPEDPKFIQEGASITRWYMTPDETLEALLKTGNIDEEEYQKRLQELHPSERNGSHNGSLQETLSALMLDEGVTKQILSLGDVKGIVLIALG